MVRHVFINKLTMEGYSKETESLKVFWLSGLLASYLNRKAVKICRFSASFFNWGFSPELPAYTCGGAFQVFSLPPGSHTPVKRLGKVAELLLICHSEQPRSLPAAKLAQILNRKIAFNLGDGGLLLVRNIRAKKQRSTLRNGHVN